MTLSGFKIKKEVRGSVDAFISILVSDLKNSEPTPVSHLTARKIQDFRLFVSCFILLNVNKQKLRLDRWRQK